MENYYEGTGQVDGNTMVKEYNDKKPFTVIIIIGITLVGLALLTGLCYSITVIVLNIFNLITKYIL